MERYRKCRLPADYTLEIETASGPAVANVVDINEYGMRICGSFTVSAGEDFTATMLDWEISGVVRWFHRPYCGILFDARAPESVVEELRGTKMTARAPGPRRVIQRHLL